MTVKNGPAARSLGTPEQAAGQNHLWIKSYQKAESLSNLKSEVGEMLWCLVFPVGKEVAESGWKLFERMLRRYISLRISQSIPQSIDTAVGTTNADQGVAR